MFNDNPHRLKSQVMQFCYRFLELEKPNAVQAAKDVGYKSPYRVAEKLIGSSEVVDTIILLREQREKRTKINIDRVVLELAKLAFLNVDDYIADISNVIVDNNGLRRARITFHEYSRIPRDVKAAISSVKETRNGIEIRWHDKQTALDKLMRHLGGYDDRLKLEGGDKPVKVEGGLSSEVRRKLDDAFNQATSK